MTCFNWAITHLHVFMRWLETLCFRIVCWHVPFSWTAPTALRKCPYIWHKFQLGLKETLTSHLSLSWEEKTGTHFYLDSNMNKLDRPGQRLKVKFTGTSLLVNKVLTHLFKKQIAFSMMSLLKCKIIHQFHFLTSKKCVSNCTCQNCGLGH